MYKDPVRKPRMLFFVLVFFAPLVVHAQDDVTVESVLAAYVKSIGDVDELKSIQTLRITSTLSTESPLGELEIKITRVQSGAKYLETREIPDVGVIRTGFDGETYWTIDPFQGARIYAGEELAWIKATDNNLLPEIVWTENFDGKIVYDGAPEVEGRKTHKLVFTPTSGPPVTRFFDNESGAIVKTAISETLPDGMERVTELVSSDYRTLEGMSIAHKHVALTPQGTTSWVINAVELNLELTDDTFLLPREIESLLRDK